MRVHLGIWCRAISIDSITFIFNPSNFLFALSLSHSLAFIYVVSIRQIHTHIQHLDVCIRDF